SADGRVDAKGSFDASPEFSAPPPFNVRIQDAAGLDVSHTFGSCRTTAKGKITCRDTVADADYRATLTPKDGLMLLKLSLRGQPIDAPFTGPVTVTLLHNSAVERSGSISDCTASDTALKCRQ